MLPPADESAAVSSTLDRETVKKLWRGAWLARRASVVAFAQESWKRRNLVREDVLRGAYEGGCKLKVWHLHCMCMNAIRYHSTFSLHVYGLRGVFNASNACVAASSWMPVSAE